MNEGALQMLLLLALLLAAGVAWQWRWLVTAPATLHRLRADWRAFHAWRAAGGPALAAAPTTPATTSDPANDPADRPVEDEGRAGSQPAWRAPVVALRHPSGAGRLVARAVPDLATTLAVLRQRAPAAGPRYHVPLGWTVVAPDGQLLLCRAALVGGINHTLITGQSNCGKDSLVRAWLLCLAAQHPPTELQWAILDGKGLDYVPFATKAHSWLVASTDDEIPPALERLDAELHRRRRLLIEAGVTTWEDYRGGDLPLLVVYIAELAGLSAVLGGPALERWLWRHLSMGRAFGLRYIIATQTVTGHQTNWRSQISLFLAGYQPSTSQDEPNTGLPTRAWITGGSLPPSALPAPPQGSGLFALALSGQVSLTRWPLVDGATTRAWLARLPDRPASADAEAGDAKAAETEATEAAAAAETALPSAPGGEGQGIDAQLDRALRYLLAQGLSANQIQEIVGGNRKALLARLKRLRGAPLTPVEAATPEPRDSGETVLAA